MRIAAKTQKWVEQGIISADQAEKILLAEQTSHTGLAWRLMFWIAGLLIGLGVILIVGANWDAIPDLLKLLANFAIWAAVIYGAYKSIAGAKNKLKEFFLTLSFLFVGATIGLVAQIFNLSGGWQSFATSWAILGFVFVIFSRLIILNGVWICLLFSALDFEFLIVFLEQWFNRNPLNLIILATVIFAMLTYAGKHLYLAINKIVVLPKAFSLLALIGMYYTALIGGASYGFTNSWANVFVFVFLGIRLLLAFKDKNMSSFIRNTHLVEFFILFLFISRFSNLLTSGFGFILGGLTLLGLLYLLKKTSKYIKTLEVFHE